MWLNSTVILQLQRFTGNRHWHCIHRDEREHTITAKTVIIFQMHKKKRGVNVENLTLLPHSEKTCIFRKVGSFFDPNVLLLCRNYKLQAIEAVRGQKRPHYVIVRLILVVL